MPRFINNRHFWVVVATFVVGIALQYPQQILRIDEPSVFAFIGLSRHAVERIFFLVPISYAGFFLGLRAGLASSILAFAIMLPRIVFISLYRTDSLFETVSIVLIGGLINLWFEVYRGERKRYLRALLNLELAQGELKSKMTALENNGRRLAALNEVSDIIGQSLELEDVLSVAADKVREVMNLEVVLIFLLDEEKQELEIKSYRGVSEEFANGLRGLKVGEGFNGQVAQTGEPLLVRDASQDFRLTREVVKQERIQAALVVPLKAKGKVVGTLSVGMHESRQFLNEEVELLTTIGGQIGIAIENARLYRKEHLMAEQIAQDAETQKQMRENLRFYLQIVTRAQEEERKRIARELHDDTAQELVALSRRLDQFISGSPRLSTREVSQLEELRRQADKTLDGVRRFSQDLRPSILDDLGLVPALEWLTSDLSDHFGITMGVGLFGSIQRFPPETELVLFRIAQEALRNVCKHSGASRAWVTLEFSDDKAILTIRDNGKGFELPEKLEDLAGTGKLGLTGMQERAKLIGGKLTLESESNKGTTISVEVPAQVSGAVNSF